MFFIYFGVELDWESFGDKGTTTPGVWTLHIHAFKKSKCGRAPMISILLHSSHLDRVRGQGLQPIEHGPDGRIASTWQWS